MQEALRYFAVPSEFWPLGLRLDQAVLLNVESRLFDSFPEAQVIVDKMVVRIARLLPAELASRWLSRKTTASARSGEDLLGSCKPAVMFGVQNPHALELIGPNWETECMDYSFRSHTIVPEHVRTAVSILGQRCYLQIRWLGEIHVQPDSTTVHKFSPDKVYGMRNRHQVGVILASIVEVTFN